MAITEADYLHVHQGESTYLLLRGSTHFHLVRVDAGLTEPVMKRLLRMYPCGDNRLRELGVTFSAFKGENLRGVVIKGYKTGDGLELWVGSDVRKFVLGSDYSEEVLSRFFSGYLITRRLPPRWEGLAPEWIRALTWSVNGIGIVCAIVFQFVGVPYRLWSGLCVLCQLSSLVFASAFPESFTLADDTGKSREQGKGNLLPGLVAPGFAMCLKTLDDFTFEDDTVFWELIGISSVVFLILFLPMLWNGRKDRRRTAVSLGVVVIMLFLGMGTIGQLNDLLDFSRPDSYLAQTVDMRVSRGTKSTTYYCTVLFSDGEQLELNLSGKTYRKLTIGGRILVTYHHGAFGIPFFTAEPQPEGAKAGRPSQTQNTPGFTAL